MNSKNLTALQLKAIDLLVIGEPINRVAKACKIDQSTLYLWRQQPSFKHELELRKVEIYQQATGSLRSLITVATQQLSNILTDAETPQATRLRAVELILNTIKPEPVKVDVIEAVKVLVENGALPPKVMEKVGSAFSTFERDVKSAFNPTLSDN